MERGGEVGRERAKGEEIEKEMMLHFGSPLPCTDFHFQLTCGSNLK